MTCAHLTHLSVDYWWAEKRLRNTHFLLPGEISDVLQELLQDINVKSIWMSAVSPSKGFSNRHTFLCQTVQMNIPCGTNCRVNAQLFDLQGAYKAMMKGIILYWLINAFSLSVQLAICQTSAHHWGHKYDLLSYCLPFVPRGLESSVDCMPKMKLFTLQFPKCGDFAV